MVKGYILKTLSVQRLHVDVVLQGSALGLWGLCSPCDLKMSYIRGSCRCRQFFSSLWRETLTSRLPWLWGNKPETHDVNMRKTGDNEHLSSSLSCALFPFFFFFYRMISPVFHCTVWTGSCKHPGWVALSYCGSIKRTNLSEDLYFFKHVNQVNILIWS